MKKSIFLMLVLLSIISLIPGVVEAKLVACIGDSNTEGHGLPDPINECYPAQLERLLRQFDPHWETRNFGVSGTTVLSQGDNPYISTTEYTEALESEPDVVILCFGTNASRLPNRGQIEESFVSDYINLIDAFAALPSEPEIWLCYPLKAFSTMYTISDEIIKDQIIPLITQIASEKELPIIDFYTAFENSQDLLQWDGIHPNPDGTRLMAEIVSAFLSGVKGTPDLNGDGIVDGADLCIVVDHWLTNEPSCDLAPPPFGDGIVDVQDLIVLAEHLFEKIPPLGLIDYWKLDEAEGDIAYNSTSDNHGILYGEPLWQPESGNKGGALEFDGIDDYIETDFVLNPTDGAFSAFMWIRGGMPGQVILSQTDSPGGKGEICLGADAVEGKLMTTLRSPSGRSPAPPMVADSIITDGQWHHVGIVVTEQKVRYLYVDGIEVVVDPNPVILPSSDGDLYIGAGKNLDADSFFSGLIDDIRIYNVALTAEQIAALAQ